MTTRECKLEGYALCKVELDGKSYKTDVVLTYITVPAIYTPDWQCDVYSWHDEGVYDYDIDKAEAKYPDEYKYITLQGELKQGEGKITRVIEVLKENLQEAM